MKFRLLSLLLFIGIQQLMAQENSTEKIFIANPYLQIGREPSAQSLELVWHVADADATWFVEERTKDSNAWTRIEAINFTRVAVTGVDPHRIYHIKFNKLDPGSTFYYRVIKNKVVVFEAEGKAPKSDKQNYRFVAIGDIGALTPDQKLLAVQAYKAKPDMVVVAGDIVYNTGLISEYRTKFWNIYNSDKETEQSAPIMRSVPFVAAPGNHDIATRDLDRLPQALAYFMFWDQPLNGPNGPEGSAWVPLLKGSDENKNAFKAAAGDAYPRMGNFSFNYGNAHWLYLDSNPYVNWSDKTLTDWIKNDLASAKGATWRFVVFHHPGFNSSRQHFEEQQMRVLSPAFEAGNVDVVITGHVHNYQRTYPLTFTPDPPAATTTPSRGRIVNGKWVLDNNFNGKTVTKPKGIIYIVTGAGGADLYNPEQQDDKNSWQTFTSTFISKVHSLTVVDVEGKTLNFRQIAADGKEVDAFKVTK
ncbi:metallophosphoesterase [Mucilaginibacter mali]|uniref:Metallophosphoesterase n=1 Tax=Mucilaginibacter mali TaxID=2740462 RepID=A0A7D4Q404_9SPHI|nr:metallophosphoesterase [Mucilaginibacter mali]QKJ30607.1 metallophosphoesterase [Mucilaginibacter mali]